MYQSHTDPPSRSRNPNSRGADRKSRVRLHRQRAATLLLVALASVLAAAPAPSAAQGSRTGLSVNLGPAGGSAGTGVVARFSGHHIRGKRALLARYGVSHVDKGDTRRSLFDASVMVGYAPQSSWSGRAVVAGGLAAVRGQRIRCNGPLGLTPACYSRSDVGLQPAVALQAGLYQPLFPLMGVSLEATAILGGQGVIGGLSFGLMLGDLM